MAWSSKSHRLECALLLTVWFLGIACDQEPRFTSTPTTRADHNRLWQYSAEASDPNDDPLAIAVEQAPDWLAFDQVTHTLSGIAGWDQLGEHRVRLSVSDGVHQTEQAFTMSVVRGEILCDAEFGEPSVSPYILPFPAGESYPLSQGNCPSNPAWGHHNWFAYDFDMPDRSLVLASRGGTVLFVQSDQPNVGGVCGQNAENFVFIEHDDGTVMHYVHLYPGEVFVEPGQVVQQGEAIGRSGNSGCSAGPHLHVAAFRDATSFDRRATLPVNYANAGGPLTNRGGLVEGEIFTALPVP